MVDVEEMSTDVLVIGGGLAALRAAIAAREAGADVLVCSKGLAGRSGNTIVSTADISAYIPELGTDDSKETFAEDTLQSGASIADSRLVRLLVERSGAALLDLERLGVHLLRAGDGIDRTRAAGHSRARTYRADASGFGSNKGLALSLPLAARARALGVRFLDRTPVVQLCAVDGEVVGAIAVQRVGKPALAQTPGRAGRMAAAPSRLTSSAILAVDARAVVLASGGASHLFARANGTGEATGDGIALALRAGAVARDLEFVQWHPTRMDRPVPLFLSNGLLADGAVFRDASGREFMYDYDPRGNLAPRDVLAKAVYTEIACGRGVDGGVYLDCSAIPPERISLRHASIQETVRKHGVDFPRQWLVASPATHFLMGGIAIDSSAASSLGGLFAAGESAGGIHGANRLGGNAFCEGLVFGAIAGCSAASYARERPATHLAVDATEELLQHIDPSAQDIRPQLSALWQQLRDAMWRDASIVRSACGLASVEACLQGLAQEAVHLRARTSTDAARILELRRGLDCARAIVAPAAFREESRGAHWREDFPQSSPAWLGHIRVSWPAGQSSPSLAFIVTEANQQWSTTTS